ncbi:MAG TPA: penicillin-binding protein [Vicinamibacterales bacterium]|nr:penicillin-binding protein [Vicinamibacterales bacterium]
MADTPANVWRTTLKRRVGVAFCTLLVWAVAIEARLVYLQVFRHADLAARADRQQSRTIEAPAKRGEILDRHGRLLAYSVDAETIYAVPNELGDPERAATILCTALQDCDAADRQNLADRIRKGKYFAYVRRQVSPDQAQRVAALELDGIGFVKENQRRYPNRELASHLLGYVGVDNVGLSGIEGTYDSLIRGKAGTVLVQTDARRHAFSRVERPPTSGASIELTVDRYLQHIAERELRAGVESSRASAGSVVIMDPFTGEILAMANAPTFNPNAYRDFRDDQRRNRAIQDLYEPGSTFKIVTAGAAFEEKAITPSTMIDASTGTIRFGSRVIHDDHNYGVLSFSDVIVKSSNVGAIKVAVKLGPDTISDYVRRFGFGRQSSPDFRGESPGIVWDPAKLTDSALASVAMGYQVGVTPLQMAMAVSAVANGGQLVQPRAVRAVIRDRKRLAVPHKILERSISAGTAATLTQIMEKVVEDGTGGQAQIEGYAIAGKTGTAKKLVNGSYRGHSEYNVSFVGFVPSRKPMFTIVVMVDSPHKGSRYGGAIAAPIFQKIASAALRHHGVPQSINAPEPLLATRRAETPEQPASGPSEPPQIVSLGGTSPNSSSLFPDLTGMSARDSLRVLARLGLTARLRGMGVVVQQQPAAGTTIDSGGTVFLRLDRQGSSQIASATKP